MAFATSQDVETRVGRDLTTAEIGQAGQLLDAATAIMAEAAGKDDEWAADLDPVPQVLKTVCIEIVARVIDNPSNLDSFRESIGAYSYSKDFRAGYLMPTPPERDLIRRVVGTATTGSPRMDSYIKDIFPLYADKPTEWID